MNTRNSLQYIATAAILAAAAGPAAAQESARDEATGFGVVAAAGYVAERSPPQAPGEVVFIVSRPGDLVTGCRVSFHPQESFGRMTQQQLNTMPDNPDLYRTGLADSFDVRSVDPFEHAGVRGAAVVADFKPAARSDDLRARVFIFYTPRGPVRVACVGEKTSFEARRTEFETIARAVTFPR